MANVFISCGKADLNSNLKEAEEKAKKEGFDDLYVFNGVLNQVDMKTIDLTEDGEIYVDGELEGFGTIHIDVPLDIDLVIKIVERYMKRLGKLKTVLEATK